MKHKHQHDFKTTLRNKGLKVTPFRCAILKVLTDVAAPISAEEIGAKIKDVNYDRATLFRTLKTFTELNITNAIDLGEGSQRYEINCEVHHHHHHIVCTRCKNVEVVPFCIPDRFKKILQKKGYINIAHRLDFSGVCGNCVS
jgi:Fur family transcriptional regulator, ferric uptake regulator